MQENENHTGDHSFKIVIGKILRGIPDLFFVNELRKVRPTLLTYLLIIVPLMIFKDKIIFGMRYLMNLIGR